MKHNIHNNESGFFLPHRELSWIIAVALLLSLTMFCAGYFWGQRRAVTQFLSKVKEESFADALTYGMYAFGQMPETEEEVAEEGTEEGTETEVGEENNQLEVVEKIIQEPESTVRYVAPLVGFGTLSAARSFAQRVQERGTPVVIKERASTTQKGKKIVWYQAVTHEYQDKAELQQLIDKIKRAEKIEDVTIIEKKG